MNEANHIGPKSLGTDLELHANRFLVLESNAKNEHAGHGNADDPDGGQGHVG